MKNGLSVLLILCTTTVFSQKNKVGLSFSTDAAYRIYKSDVSEIWGENQIPKMGYTLTAHYERELTKKWSFTSGVIFTNKGYQNEKSDLRYSDQILPKKGFVIASQEVAGPVSYKYRYNFYQIGIPLGINYYIPVKKLKFIIGTGIAANYLVNVRYAVVYELSDGNTKTTKKDSNPNYYTNVSLSAFGHMGIEFNLPRNLKFRIAPNVSYSLTNVMDKNISYKIYPYSIGIEYGVFWGF